MTLTSLHYLIKDNAVQVKTVDSIKTLIQKHLPALQKKHIPELIAGEEWRFADLKLSHDLIDRGLAKEETLLQERRTELTASNTMNNTFTLVLAIFAIAIITITFFSQFFLSKKSKWLEGFLESILNTSQNGILHCRAVRSAGKIIDFKLDFANKSSSDLLGPEPAKLTGRRWAEIAALKDSALFTICNEVVRSGNAIEMEYVDRQKQLERWFILSIAKMEDGVTIAFYQNTEMKATEQELKKNIAALEQSNRELEEYAYAASHDLQEPLRKIRTFGSFLQDTQQVKMDERGQEQLNKILQSAERMTLLIKDLLSFSSLKQREEFVPTDLNEIVENVKQDFEVPIEQTGAIITHDALPEIPAIPVQMNQLFYNLIGNALKFAKKDLPLRLDISCRIISSEEVGDVHGLSPDKQYYEIIVSDNGIGFNQDYASQIFGLFKRLNDKHIYAGSGIGLALCKKVVMNHDGVIMANGKEGVGAQFYIYLPLANEVT
jgi:signal transduction histidine kinase